MNVFDLSDDDGRDQDVSRVRDEAASKNAVRNRMLIDKVDVPPDRLVGVVACGRDFFHTFINGTIGRRYKRPPIYLVDSCVTTALGAFMAGGRRRLPGVRSGHGSQYDLDVSAPVSGLGPTLALFRALHDVQEILRGVRLLRIDAATRRLEELCLGLIQRKEKVDTLAHEAQQLGELVQRAIAALQRDLFVGPYVEPALAQQLQAAIAVLLRAAEAAVHAPMPEIPGTGFSTTRGSGVLFGGIPELDIEGPAILLAPARILGWAQGFGSLRAISHDIPDDWMEEWFGVKDPRHRAGAIALVNVLHHEMTHAMVDLPNDPIEDAQDLFAQRWRFYDQHPEFEEGFCNATAAVSTGVTLLKAMYEIKGRGLPKLHEGKYAAHWDEVFCALSPTWQDYHGDPTNIWLNAWQSNKRDFKAFSGLIGLYATNFSGFDWMATFAAFQRGQISTGR